MQIDNKGVFLFKIFLPLTVLFIAIYVFFIYNLLNYIIIGVKMKVVILAGGFGTRLSEETTLIPKPLVEIGGKPILWHIMKIYSYYGFNDFIILTGYKSHLIKRLFYKLL